MKITTAAEMREIDRITTERFGVPSLALMEKAGSAVAQFVLERYPQAQSVGVICGKGNNGGDGFVAARKLREAGKRVQVVMLADPSELRGDAAAMFSHMGFTPTFVRSAQELSGEAAGSALKCEVLVDALLGTGFKPPVKGLFADAITAINHSGRPVVAVDIPSGADADAFVSTTTLRCRADGVVTFTAPRPAHIFDDLTRGDTLIAPIGSPEEAIQSELNLRVITPRDFADFLKPRDPEGHKGKYGSVLVIAGSFGKSGAAAMSGTAVLRAGAGLSTVAIPKSALPIVASYTPELMTVPLAETTEGTITRSALDQFDVIAKGKDVIALGPGLSRNPETVELIRAVVERSAVPTVVDADGLNAYEGAAGKLSGERRPLVLTPHPGEMARLTGLSTKQLQADRINVARRFAQEHHCILVLKGNRTLVALPSGEVWVNTTGNPGMATGGSGDVLTGIIAGLLGQAHSLQAQDANERAVLASVHIHGLAGDVARERMGEHGLIATDIITALPEAFRRASMKLHEPNFVFHG